MKNKATNRTTMRNATFMSILLFLLTASTVSAQSYGFIHRDSTIDEVKGNGTSHSLINYSYVDETIPTHENIVYYRLNQVDYNGKSELSDIRLVQFKGFSNAPLLVYPNPTKSQTTILLGDNVSQGEYTITDLVGKQWMADIVRAGSKSIELDFTNLPSGVYIATLNTENDSKHVRIVKQQ
ncbi:MAG: T9SS type A sorting domain-containing protein [Bacteroidia bacterium]|nr:T9SS type A sorting domain-containing protein [Bacteroidia bacterium]